MKIKKINDNGEELTRYAFISHIESYLKKLLSNPKTADTDDFLKSFGLDGPTTLKILLHKAEPNNDRSSILIRTENIRNGKTSEDGKREKDKFIVKYQIPRKDYNRKMRNLYINLFENYMCDNPSLNEDGEGGDGATNATSSGQYTTPLFKNIVRRKIYVTEEQMSFIKSKLLSEDCPSEMDTSFGNFGYDAPGLKKKQDPSYNHKNIFKNSWNN